MTWPLVTDTVWLVMLGAGWWWLHWEVVSRGTDHVSWLYGHSRHGEGACVDADLCERAVILEGSELHILETVSVSNLI